MALETPTALDVALGDATTIPEEQAWGAFQTLRTLKSEDPQFAPLRRDLESYVGERRKYGRTVFPTFSRQANQAREQYLTGLFTKPLEQVLPADKLAELEKRASFHPDPEAFKQRTANRAYITALAGKEIPAEHYEPVRNAYAKQALGLTGDTGDKAVFAAIKGRFSEDEVSQKQIAGLSQQAFLATLTDAPALDAAQAIAALPERHREAAATQLQTNQREARRVKRKLSPVVDSVMAEVDKEAKRLTDDVGNSNPGGAEQFADAVAKLPQGKEERQLALAMLAARFRALPDKDKGFVFRFEESLARGLTLAYKDAEDMAGNLGIQAMKAVGADELAADTEEYAQARRDVREFTRLYQGEADPLVLASDNFLKKGFVLAAGSAWTIPATLMGPAGFIGMSTSMGGSSFNNARAENPEADAGAQLAAATLSGPSQAFVETAVNKLGFKAITGKMPGLAGIMNKMGINSVIGRSAVGGAGAFVAMGATEYAEEAVQSAIDTSLQDLALEFSNIAPTTDWKQFWTDWATVGGQEQQDTMLAVMPFALVGAGGASFSHFKYGKALSQNKTLLRAIGVPEEKVRAITRSTDIAAADKAMQEAFTAGLEARTAEQRAAALDILREQNTLLEKAGIPRVTKDTNSFTDEELHVFTDPITAERVEFDSEESALEHWRNYALNTREEEIDTITEAARLGAVDFLTGEGMASEGTRVEDVGVTMTPERAIKAGIITPEQLASRVELFVLQEGLTPEQATAMAGNLTFKARSFSEQSRDGQFRYTVQLFRGANVMDVFEDLSENSFERALDAGFADGEILLDDIRRYEDATGQTLLPPSYAYTRDRRVPLLEALSALSRAHLLGNVRANTLPPEIAKWVELNTTIYSQTLLGAQNISADINRAGVFKNAIAKGDVSPRLERLIADSIGINAAALEKRLTAKMEEQLAAEAMGGFPEIGEEARGMIPHPDTMQAKGHPLAGEVRRLWESMKKTTRRKTKAGKAIDRTNEANAFFLPVGEFVDLDKVREVLNQKGFEFETPADLLDALDTSLSYGKPVYGTNSVGESSFSMGRSSITPTADTQVFQGAEGSPTVIGPASFAISAYHGTPHKVGKFSIDKIGTGEGAQAYGWGLYFAQAQKVAEEYRKILGSEFRMDGEIFLKGGNFGPAHRRIYEDLGEEAADILVAFIDQGKARVIDELNNPLNQIDQDTFDRASDFLDRIEATNSGNLYTVTLKVEDEDLLDWDKPLSEQSEKVKSALQKMGGEIGRISSTAERQYFDAPTAYGTAISQHGSPQTASQALLAAGIRGIRFLDGNSRRLGGSKYKARWDNNDPINGTYAEVYEVATGQVVQTFDTFKEADEWMESNKGEGSHNYVVFDDADIEITEENGAPVKIGESSFSIGVTVAPVRKDALSELTKGEVQKRSGSAKFIHLQQVASDVADAYGVTIEGRQPTVGGWTENGEVSLEVPEVILFDTNDMELAEEMAALIAASAPELQNAAMIWRDDEKGDDHVVHFTAKSAGAALAIAQDLEMAGVQGFSYDTQTRQFSLVLAGVKDEDVTRVHEYLQYQTKQGSVSPGKGIEVGKGSARFPSEGDYRKHIENARSRAENTGGARGEAIREVASRAERRVDRYEAALKISKKAKRIIKKLPLPMTSAKAIIQELKGRTFDSIRALGLYLDDRFQKINGFAAFPVGSVEGIAQAAEAFTYDILDGLSRDGSGMGWYDERVTETIRELVKLHPEFAEDPLSLAVYIGILSTTSQGYTVVTNFAQTERVWEIYKATGRIPTDLDFAKSTEPINQNLADIQALIDEHGLQGYADFMDEIVTGKTLRDQYGMQPTGVTLTDEVRGNRFLGPKIGSFFNNLRGRFDTITMDLWYTRTMHRYLGETVVPLDNPKVQKALKSFRDEIQKDGARTYNIDIATALESDEATVRAALTVFGRWGAGKNDYTEKGYTKFKDGYKLEKAARTIHSEGTMKGAPQNKSYRTYFAAVVKETQKNLAALGIKLTEADIQAIIWYREKNLFAETGVANNAAKPADYLDAVMVARQKAGPGEELTGESTFALSPSGINRIEAAIAKRLTRGPDERAEFYERVRSNLNSLTARLRDMDAGIGPFARKPTDVAGDERRRIQDAIAEARAIITALPIETRGRVNLDFADITGATSERGRINSLIRLLEKADAALEITLKKEYFDSFERLLDLAKPNLVGKQFRGRLTPETQRLVKQIADAVTLTPVETAVKLKGIAAAIEETEANPPDLTDREATDAAQAALIQLHLDQHFLETFASLSNRTAGELAHAFQELLTIYTRGRTTRQIVDEAKREEMNAAKREVLDSLPRVTQPLHSKRTADKGLLDLLESGRLSLSSFHQVMEKLFPNSQTARRFQGEIRAADRAFVRAKIDARERFEEFMRSAFNLEGMGARRKWNKILAKISTRRDDWNIQLKEGIKSEKEKMTEEQAASILDGTLKPGWETDPIAMESLRQALLDFRMQRLKARNEDKAFQAKVIRFSRITSRGAPAWLHLSDLEAVYLLQLAAQDQYLPALDKYGFTAQVLDGIRAKLDPQAATMGTFLRKEYDSEYARLNPVFKTLYGLDMPRIRNYAPGLFDHLDGKADTNAMDAYGNPSTPVNAMSAGFTKARSHHMARPRQMNALGAFWSHLEATEYFIAYAETMRDMRQIFRNPEVRRSLEGNYGTRTAGVFSTWLDALEVDGKFRAANVAGLQEMTSNTLAAQSAIGLAYNLGVLFKQVSAATGVMIEMKTTDAIKGIIGTLRDPKSLKHVWGTEAIQQRILAGMNPEDKRLLDAANASPSMVMDLLDIGRLPIAWADAAFTTVAGSIAYNHHLQAATKAGLGTAAAEKVALEAMDRVVTRIAQPATTQDKSLAENTANGFGRFLFLFKSDPRQKVAITLGALRDLQSGTIGKAEAARRFLWAWAVYGLLGEVMSDIWAGISRDDDDEDRWAVSDYAAAMVAGPVSGIPLIGAALSYVTTSTIGTKAFSNSTNPIDNAANRIFRDGLTSATYATFAQEDELDVAAVLSAIQRDTAAIAQLAGAIDPRAAIVPAAIRAVRDAAGLLANAGELVFGESPEDQARKIIDAERKTDTTTRSTRSEEIAKLVKELQPLTPEARAARIRPLDKELAKAVELKLRKNSMTASERALSTLGKDARARAIDKITAGMDDVSKSTYLARIKTLGIDDGNGK